MSKGLKLGLTYVITLIAAFAIFGFMGWLFIDIMRGDASSEIAAPVTAPAEYTPTAADRRTIIAVADLGDKKSDVVFMLIRFLPEDTNAVFLPLPPDTICGGSTLYELYRNGSGTGARDGAEAALGIDIDKYIVMDSGAFETFCGLFSGTTYTVPYNLIFTEETGAQTVILQGQTYLDADTVKSLLTCGGYKNGEEERTTAAVQIIGTMLNAKLTSNFAEFLDNTFNTIINSGVTTDISKFDYDESRDALRYTVTRTDRFCRSAFPTGTFDGNGGYVLDPNFLNVLDTLFKIDEND
jgi:anionic cell wall polymer biosynthesis LytR-Cps2A-Psr (LCP) family protein